MTASTKRIRWYRLFAVCGAVCLALLVGELIVSLSGVNRDFRELGRSRLFPKPGGPTEMLEFGYVPRATLELRYPTNPRGDFDVNNGVLHQFNSVGWRDVEHPLKKSSGTYRILGLGDSYLFGHGVRPEDICLSRLRQRLQADLPSRPMETINTGLPAYNTAREVALLKACGLAYGPDLVILHFVPNDVEPDVFTERPKVEFFTEFTNTHLADDRLSEYSELWALARRKVLAQVNGRAYIRQSLASFSSQPDKWDSCRAALAELKRVCAEQDVPLLIVVFPFLYQLNGDYPFQPIHDHVRQFCEAEQVPMLDLRESYRAFSGSELWVHPTDQHPNKFAHDLAANAIHDYLMSRRKQFRLDVQ